MQKISAALVKTLRDQTSAGMLDCKDALVEANGDLELAVDVLRRRGIASGEKKMGREANEGRVEIYISPSCPGRIVEVNCETDFVASNQNFRDLVWDAAIGCATEEDVKLVSGKLGEKIVIRRTGEIDAPAGNLERYVHSNGKIGVLLEIIGCPPADGEDVGRNIAMHIAASKPKYVRREDVPYDLVEKERAFLLTQPDLASKPEAIRPKMVEGRLNKFYAELCLLEQPFVKDPKQTVGAVAKKYGAQVMSFIRFEVGE